MKVILQLLDKMLASDKANFMALLVAVLFPSASLFAIRGRESASPPGVSRTRTDSARPYLFLTGNGPSGHLESAVDCAVCRRLETEVERLERDHAEKLALLNEYRMAFVSDYERFRRADRAARKLLETLQGQLHEHKRNHKGPVDVVG